MLARAHASRPDYSILKYVIVGDAAVGKSCLLVRLTDDKFANAEPTLGVEFGSKILTVGDEGKRVKVQCWDTAGTESFRSITRSYFRGAAGALLVYDVTRRETFEHVTSWLDDLRTHAEENCSIILVANKTDLCSTTPTALPQIQFGEAVSPSDVDPEDTSGLPTNPTNPTNPTSDPTSDSGPGSGPGSGSNTPGDATGDGSGGAGGDGGNGGDGAGKGGLLPRAVSTLEGAFFAKQHGLLYVETSAKEGWGVVEAFEWTARQMLERIEQGQVDRKAKTVELSKSGAKGGCC